MRKGQNCPICQKVIDTKGSFCDNCGADISSIQTGRAANAMTGQNMTGQTTPGQQEQPGFGTRRVQPRRRSNSRFMFFMIFMGIYYLTDGFANWNF